MSSDKPYQHKKKREKNNSEGDFDIKCKLFEIRDSPDYFDLD